MSAEAKIGTVTHVLMSPNHGYPTYPQERVIVGPMGIEGDAHSGSLRDSFTKPGTLKPNDRPISIVSLEVMEEMNETLGLHMQPGDFNEQVLVSGAGDLADVKIGSQVIFEGGVHLKVVDNAQPCVRLEAHNGPGLIKALVRKDEYGKIYTKRGILARVIQPGELRPGTNVIINPPVQS